MMTISMLLNLNELKKIAKMHGCIDVLLSIKEKLELIIEQKREEESVSIKKMAEKQKRIKMYRELLQQDGISPSELLPNKPILKTTQIMKPKKGTYIYYDGDKQKFWSGRGRMPGKIKRAIECGKSLDSFIYLGGEIDR
ncbi:TPA: H-NS family nucleoid-associated regulatory protein [Escherichia coli]|uniref:H-NS family histone-like protein n=1 Tax=Citrobacter TaxID=544 RepID=UPI00126E17E9|nr:H-NS family nucleoid-associated regulatory protein [Citrobacter sp. S39]ECE8410962.1 hypothetical protein [Salmonella enterica subsp. enterica serovar Anatum]ECL5445093.1 hypothetical protein [Salmonella enterica]EDM7166984.1 hypothetical protein [Salmonella enterica subsp. enterica serovar Litchfield]EDS6040795.1 H-NS histone family protein [Salmonella enterica subsp. enterica serovar Lexington]EFE0694123.1 H-NS histone family protein [Escherichia coli]EJN7219162.1 H-NS histone family pro